MARDLPRPAVHLAVWAAVGLVYLLLLAPLLGMAALDFELLVVNQYEQDAASLDNLGLARALVRWGPAPLLVCGLAHALYTFAKPWTGVVGPFAVAGRWRRWGLRLALLAPFLAALAPLAVVAGVWAAVQVFGWIEWHMEVDPALAVLFQVVPVAAAACMLWASFKLAATFRDKAPRRPPRRGLRLVLGALVDASGWPIRILSVVVLLVIAPQAVRVATTPARSDFEAQCGGCHFRSASLSYVKTPAEWGHVLTRMSAKLPAPLDERTTDRIAGFLSGVRGLDRDDLFDTRCGRCHGSTWRTWHARPRHEWERIVHGRSRWSPDYYRVNIAAELVDWLDDELGDEGASVGIEPAEWARYDAVGQACATCHSISWNADRWATRDRDETWSMVERMSQKMVDPLTAEQLDSVTDAYMSLVRDPDLFDHLFPHDRPEPEPQPSSGLDSSPRPPVGRRVY